MSLVPCPLFGQICEFADPLTYLFISLLGRVTWRGWGFIKPIALRWEWRRMFISRKIHLIYTIYTQCVYKGGEKKAWSTLVDSTGMWAAWVVAKVIIERMALIGINAEGNPRNHATSCSESEQYPTTATVGWLLFEGWEKAWRGSRREGGGEGRGELTW